MQAGGNMAGVSLGPRPGSTHPKPATGPGSPSASLSPHVLNRRESLLLCHLTCAEGVTQAKEKGRIAELSYNAGLSGGTRAVPSHAPTTVPLSLAAPSFHSRHWDGKSEVCLPLILLGSLFPAQGLQPWLSDLTWPCCGRDPISGRVAWPCG